MVFCSEHLRLSESVTESVTTFDWATKITSSVAPSGGGVVLVADAGNVQERDEMEDPPEVVV
jgi:hypothetical protein